MHFCLFYYWLLAFAFYFCPYKKKWYAQKENHKKRLPAMV